MSQFKKKLIKYIIIDLFIGLGLVLLMRLYAYHWQYPQDFFYISGAILFAFGWMMFVINEGIFDTMVYGIQQFAKSLVGLRMKKSFEEYRLERKLVEKAVYWALWIAAVVYVLIGVVINLLVWSYLYIILFGLKESNLFFILVNVVYLLSVWFEKKWFSY